MSGSRAGTPATPEDLIDVTTLVAAYYTRPPTPTTPTSRSSSGPAATAAARCARRSTRHTSWPPPRRSASTAASQGYDGPLFVGRDTHGLSEPAWATALEVLVANDVTVLVDAGDGYTPDARRVSHAIVRRQRGAARTGSGLADGIVVTPSHNPPARRRLQVQPAARRPRRLRGDLGHRRPGQRADPRRACARCAGSRSRGPARAVGSYDFLGAYVDDLPAVLDLDAIRAAGVRIGADPLGGASVDYWGEIAERHRLDLTVVNPQVDPTWRFMTLDWDGKIRMDCSSPYAMASLIARKDDYDLATGNDADADRHGIVTPDAGLMNPNHFLAVAIGYLFGGARPGWPAARPDRQDAGLAPR